MEAEMPTRPSVSYRIYPGVSKRRHRRAASLLSAVLTIVRQRLRYVRKLSREVDPASNLSRVRANGAASLVGHDSHVQLRAFSSRNSLKRPGAGSRRRPKAD